MFYPISLLTIGQSRYLRWAAHCSLLMLLTAVPAAAQDKSATSALLAEPEGYTDTPFIPGQSWRVHDKYRPRPPVVTPAETLGDAP